MICSLATAARRASGSSRSWPASDARRARICLMAREHSISLLHPSPFLSFPSYHLEGLIPRRLIFSFTVFTAGRALLLFLFIATRAARPTQYAVATTPLLGPRLLRRQDALSRAASRCCAPQLPAEPPAAQQDRAQAVAGPPAVEYYHWRQSTAVCSSDLAGEMGPVDDQ